jgi:hypothetical protein
MNNLDDFFKSVDKLLRTGNFNDCPMPLFRGHSKVGYELLPTLHRSYQKTKKDIWTLENNLYCDFRSMVGPRVSFKSSWETLFAMRHEGIPTRLLDWTESIGTSLFFALNTTELDKPHIWVLNPYKLNEQNQIANGALVNPDEDLPDYQKTYGNFCNDQGQFIHKLPVAIYPNRTNDRIFAQKGWFTIHGTDERKMEESYPDSIKKINIPMKLVPKLRSLIKHFGINSYSVYPDFKGLCEYLKEVYRY